MLSTNDKIYIYGNNELELEIYDNLTLINSRFLKDKIIYSRVTSKNEIIRQYQSTNNIEVQALSKLQVAQKIVKGSYEKPYCKILFYFISL